MNYFLRALLIIFTLNVSYGFEIDPFKAKASLLENFSTNCLQMTQSQQMLKAYILVGLNSKFENPKENLLKAIYLYDNRAQRIRDYFKEQLNGYDGAKIAFDKAMDLWNRNKVMLLATPTKKNALKIKSNFLVMIEKLLEGTQPLATPELELISLTGKLCRKPLEITIDYLLKIWGVKLKNYDDDVENIIRNYRKNLVTLTLNQLNNPQSRILLKKAKDQFQYFIFAYKNNTLSIPALLSRKADNNFKIIREIKRIFKKEARENNDI